MREYRPDDRTWHVDSYAYDPTNRVLGDGRPMQFDEEGRLTRRGLDGSDNFEKQTYDEQGNVREWSSWQGDQLRDGARWSNLYEGTPPRLVGRDISDFRSVKDRNAPHTRERYRYDDAGRVIEERQEGRHGRATRRFIWKANRIVTIHEALDPLDPRRGEREIGFEASTTFEYDDKRRLTAYVRDGEMPPAEGSYADGEPDERVTYHYDAAGHLERRERDGQIGDVAPEAPDGKSDAITLYSPACDPLTRLAPRVFDIPELFLPESITPPFR